MTPAILRMWFELVSRNDIQATEDRQRPTLWQPEKNVTYSSLPQPTDQCHRFHGRILLCTDKRQFVGLDWGFRPWAKRGTCQCPELMCV